MVYSFWAGVRSQFFWNVAGSACTSVSPFSSAYANSENVMERRLIANSNEKQSIIIVILFFFMIPVPFSGEVPNVGRLFRESAKLVNGFIYGHFTCPKTINSLSQLYDRVIGQSEFFRRQDTGFRNVPECGIHTVE